VLGGYAAGCSAIALQGARWLPCKVLGSCAQQGARLVRRNVRGDSRAARTRGSGQTRAAGTGRNPRRCRGGAAAPESWIWSQYLKSRDAGSVAV